MMRGERVRHPGIIDKETMTKRDLINRIKSGKTVIYGTGFVASLFKEALTEAGLYDRIVAYAVSEQPSVSAIDGRPVLGGQALDKFIREEAPHNSILICLAVHEAAAGVTAGGEPDGGGLWASLRERFLPLKAEVVWIYPLLNELLYGEILRTEYLPARELARIQNGMGLWLAARYLAACVCLKDLHEAVACSEDTVCQEMTGSASKDKVLSLYIKAMACHTKEATARARFDKLRELVRSMSENGFDKKHPLLIDEGGRVIDGLHRLATALALGIDMVPCQVVRENPVFDRTLTEKNRLPVSYLKGHGFSAEEIETLKRAAAETEMSRDLCLSGTGAPDRPGAEREASALRRGPEFSPEISVILPVYNVGAYLDVCMESLISQTFADFEAILINDGSSDDSLDRCLAWAARDSRVRVIDQPNRGVALARNAGMDAARGSWYAFIDPDDWVDETYLEKLLNAAVASGSAYAECDLYRVSNRDGSKIHRICSGQTGVPYTLREHMKYGPTAMYKAISRRSLWEANHVRLPDCSFESPAVYSLILALSGQVASVSEPLYYYRRFRENSLIETGYAAKDGSANNTLGIEAMAHLIAEFKRVGLYETYKETLPGVVTYRLNDILAMQFHRKTPEDFAETVANFRGFLKETFPGGRHDVCMNVSGYNLNRVLSHRDVLHDPSGRMNFASLIQLGLESRRETRCFEPAIRHKNRYREIMLRTAGGGAFWSFLKERQPAYLFVDLIEERFDILELDGSYLTKSDAFDGRLIEEADPFEDARLIERDSPEAAGLFAKAADMFVRGVRSRSPGTVIFVVENYLAETVGDMNVRKPFENGDEIRKTNRLLAGRYAALRDALEGKDAPYLWLKASELPHYFTDRAYEYGAIPSHLNEIVNREIASEIDRLIGEYEREKTAPAEAGRTEEAQ